MERLLGNVLNALDTCSEVQGEHQQQGALAFLTTWLARFAPIRRKFVESSRGEYAQWIIGLSDSLKYG